MTGMERINYITENIMRIADGAGTYDEKMDKIKGQIYKDFDEAYSWREFKREEAERYRLERLGI